MQRIEEALKLLKDRAAAAPPPAAPATPAAAKTPGDISVCAQGCDFQDLQKAVDAAPAGGRVSVAAEISGSCAVIKKSLHLLGLRGEGGLRAHLAGGVCWGKAPLVTAGEGIVIEGFEISGVSVADGNGACIRMDPGTRNLVVRNVYCHDSQNALLGTVGGRLLVEDSLFERTVPGPGLSHGFYLNDGDEAVIRRCKILSVSNRGHSLKSGYQKLLVEDSVIAGLGAHNSRAIDAFRGGEIVLRRNVIQQGPESDNDDVVALATEPKRVLASRQSLLMEDNWVIFDDPGRGNKILLKGQELGPIVLRNNAFVGLTGLGARDAKEEGSHWFESRGQAGLPAFDGTTASLPAPGKVAAANGKAKKPASVWNFFGGK